jgi:hypothetical protein
LLKSGYSWKTEIVDFVVVNTTNSKLVSNLQLLLLLTNRGPPTVGQNDFVSARFPLLFGGSHEAYTDREATLLFFGWWMKPVPW